VLVAFPKPRGNNAGVVVEQLAVVCELAFELVVELWIPVLEVVREVVESMLVSMLDVDVARVEEAEAVVLYAPVLDADVVDGVLDVRP
jgi:hypothetical protein